MPSLSCLQSYSTAYTGIVNTLFVTNSKAPLGKTYGHSKPGYTNKTINKIKTKTHPCLRKGKLQESALQHRAVSPLFLLAFVVYQLASVVSNCPSTLPTNRGRLISEAVHSTVAF